MKILWVSPFLPHATAPHAGGRALSQWLSRTARDHDVTLLCRVDGPERAGLEVLRPLLRALHLHEFSRPPAGALQSLRIAASYLRLGRAANRLLRGGAFDVLHVEYLETGLGIDRTIRVPKVAVAIDELARPARQRLAIARGPRARLGAYLYWRAIQRVQGRICRKFDRILALSEGDRGRLLEMDGGLSVGVLPFPVGIEASAADGAGREEAALLFVGAMSRDVNVDAMRHFCTEILPRIRAEVPAVRLSIVGGGPTEEVQRLAASGGVQVTGFVPALEPFYRRATVFVSPLRVVGGILSKNVDAMAAGCPVVTTSIGNEALGGTPGVHLLTADTPADFAGAVVRLLRDAPLRRRLAEAGRELVRERFSLEASLAALEREHRAVAGVTTR